VSAELAMRLIEMGIRDERVLRAMAAIRRSLFVPESLRAEAEADRPLAIGFGQTISQPYIVAFMSEWLRLSGTEHVLEIGTGSGYQTAILSELAREVDSIEIIPELSDQAAEVLFGTLQLANVRLEIGDGTLGWPDRAPYDRIVVTAAPETIPDVLLQQLSPGGRMVIPVGDPAAVQTLKVIDLGGDLVPVIQDVLPVRFVPMTGGLGAS
jgi:protein-L-isoaspartate(D-aspartate) O-methyltransferase